MFLTGGLPMIQLTNFLVTGGTTLCWLAALLIFKHHRTQRADKWLLSLCFVLLGMIAVLEWGILRKGNSILPWAFYIDVLIGYLIPPSFFVYLQQLHHRRKGPVGWVHLVHLLPFLAACIELAASHTGWSQQQAWFELLFMNDLTRLLYGCLYIGLIAAYFGNAFRKERLKRLTRRTQRLIVLFYGMIVLYYAGMVVMAVRRTPIEPKLLEKMPVATFPLFSLYFFWVSLQPFFLPHLLYALKDTPDPPAWWRNVLPETDADSAQVPTDSLHTRPLLSEEKVMEYAVLLTHCMEKEQLFKRISRLAELADHLHTSPRYLSYVISTYYQKSFNDYVNTYRIHYVMDAIAHKAYEKFTLEAIGQDAGFASRSTFFKVFKKHTGISPAQFIKNKEDDAFDSNS